MWFLASSISQLSTNNESVDTETRSFDIVESSAPIVDDSTSFTFLTTQESAERAQAGSSGLSTAPLFSFLTATFQTPISGGYGPNLAQARSVLLATGDSSWSSNIQYFNVINGYQYFTIPSTGTYKIDTYGAKGGRSTNWARDGGAGAWISGKFVLTSGTKLKMVVGQVGLDNTYDGGGGGGSFVTLENNSPLIIAGGGGGGSASGFNGPGASYGSHLPNGYSTSFAQGGVNGSGGNSGNGTTGGGGGLLGNGGGNWGGLSFINGAIGQGSQATGGFGGGGGGGGTNGAGGGGGYSGGAASNWSYDGAGGGSYNGGAEPSNSAGANYASGRIIITKL